jgi:aspartate aminotransferase
VTRNAEIQGAVMSLAQARLSCSVLSQQMVAQITTLDDDARESITHTYRERLALTHEFLATIPGVHAPPAEGAFYQMATLPVRDASRFVRFMLEDFSHEGQTVLVTPAAGFYLDPARGVDQIRIACVLDLDSLRAALTCLREGLTAYVSAHPRERSDSSSNAL